MKSLILNQGDFPAEFEECTFLYKPFKYEKGVRLNVEGEPICIFSKEELRAISNWLIEYLAESKENSNLYGGL